MPKNRERALDRLDTVKRTLAGYLAGALGVALLVLVGTAVLGGTLGPFVVLAAALVLGGLLHRWMLGRLRGVPMADEDRLLQTAAGGLLGLAVAFAAMAAVVLTVSGGS